jgi:anti-anti-sigma factor
VKRSGRACVLRVSGELDIATAPSFTAQAARALEIPAERLVVDLSDLGFVDCCGARALTAVTRAVPPGCEVVLRSVNRRVRQVLDILGLRLESSPAAHNDWLILEPAARD